MIVACDCHVMEYHCLPKVCAVMYCGGESIRSCDYHVTVLTNQMAHLSMVRDKAHLKWHTSASTESTATPQPLM